MSKVVYPRPYNMSTSLQINAHIAESFDYLYEQVEEDIKGNFLKYRALIDELVDIGYIEVILVDDGIIKYKAKTGLTWAKVVEIADPIKKKILLQLIENPQCFFVLFNTQRGKLRIIGNKLADWSKMTSKRVVGYLVVDNDRTLSEQSVNGLFSCFPEKKGCEHESDPNLRYNVQIYELSSNSKTSIKDVITYIDAYAYNTHYPMPLIVVLSNNKQIEKLIKILHHIKTHTCKELCAAGGWDEADKTYPPFRDKKFTVNNQAISFLDLLIDPEERTILQNGFVTATEGQLIEEEYDECANAHHYVPEIDSVDMENYFAFHHDECVKHNIAVSSRESNNTIAERVLRENWESHFAVPLTLRDGSLYHHKIIINADVKAEDMKEFALQNRNKANIITFNMRGISLYLMSGNPIVYKIKKETLNKLLFYIYKMNNLSDRPLIIIGRRKVDRGLGFHYAPRQKGTKTLQINGKDGLLQTDGIEGLIWTDMIMGNKIEHIPTAVQKAGRGAGIIRQCPQYSGQFHYWIDSVTSSFIEHHYKMVDKANELKGTNSLIQAVSHAKSLVHIANVSTPKEEWEHGSKLFNLDGLTPEEFIESDTFSEYMSEVLGPYWTRCETDEAVGLEAVKTKARRGIAKMERDSDGFYKCGLDGKKGSKKRSTDELEQYAEKINGDESKALASWGGGDWRNKTDSNIQFKYGYSDMDDSSTLHILVKWAYKKAATAATTP